MGGRYSTLDCYAWTIVSCFAIGLIPTGSQDPYALRRQATGVCQIILEHELAISLEELVEWSLADMEAKGLYNRGTVNIPVFRNR